VTGWMSSWRGTTNIARTALPTAVCTLMAAIGAAGCDNSRGPTSPSTAGSSSTYFVSGLVRDPVQRPIADARVEVIAGVLLGSVTTTDREGRFSFSTPVPDSQPVTLRITRDGHHAATVPGGPNGFRVTLVPIDLADVRGRYTAMFSASVACTQIPETLRTRTYIAAISPTGSGRTLVTGELTGAVFQYGYSNFFGVLGSDAFRVFISSYDAFNWWLEDHPLIERLAEGGHLSIFGHGRRDSGYRDYDSLRRHMVVLYRVRPAWWHQLADHLYRRGSDLPVGRPPVDAVAVSERRSPQGE
jgi:hypothetical protein